MAGVRRISEEILAAAGRGMVVAAWAAQAPARLAIISPHGDRTFPQLNARANQLARGLRRRGLDEGDAVALMCTNRPEFAEVWAACQRTGLRLTPINWHLTGGEAGYIVDDSEAKAVIADTRLGEAARGAIASASRAGVRLAVGGPIPGFDDYDAVLENEPTTDVDAPVLGGVMLYTSGTTGRPKGVHRAPANDLATGLYDVYGYRDGDVHLCTGPLYHAAPLNISLVVPLS